MANIKQLKIKIKATQGTLKITSAMKLVSAAKFSKAQIAITNSRPYAQELESMVKDVSALVQNYSHQYLKSNEENKQSILLVIGADKGLCGGYNSQLSKKVLSFVKERTFDIKLNYVGKKVRDVVKNELNCGETYEFEKGEPSFNEVQKIANELGALFSSGEIGRVFVAYNEFKSALTFVPTVKQVLPFSMDSEELEKFQENYGTDFKYSPSPEEILDALIPETYVNTIYTCLLDAIAAEHGSRMTAMDSATKNCEEAIRVQTIKMNKLRQAAITTELIEVVSGAESLNN